MNDLSIPSTFSSIISTICMIIFVFLLIWFTAWYYKRSVRIDKNYVINTPKTTPLKMNGLTPETARVFNSKSPILSKFY